MKPLASRADAASRGGTGLLPRLLTILLASFSLPIVLPFLIGIQASSPGPIFFRQLRVGKQGKLIRVWKFRTMEANSVDQLELILRHGDSNMNAEWRAYGRFTGDPRIIQPFGRWARRLSVDEIPQLINVFMGNMAFVGPRPLPPEQNARLGPKTMAIRCSVLPGLTGLWQVSGRSDTTLRHMSRVDVLYVRRQSIALDLYIFARTPAAVIRGRGAY
jgi:exopolysaccharide production protein ExoY